MCVGGGKEGGPLGHHAPEMGTRTPTPRGWTPPHPFPTWFNSKISGLGQETRRLRV